MTQVGAGKHTYELVQDFPKLPAEESFGMVSTLATDSQDRLYIFQRKNPPVLVFDREGNYLKSWGIDAFSNPHGFTIVDDIVYTTDREDSVAVIYTLDGKPLQVIGKRGVHSDTGCEKPAAFVPRAAGPFNYPTHMVASPWGDIYVTDGYRNCRVHRFTHDGKLIKSWGQPGKTEPGHFHLPHSIVITADEKIYVADRGNKRVQIFSPDGEFISMWTGMNGPNDIARDNDGIFYICEQQERSAPGLPGFVSIRDSAGTLLARWESRPGHGLWVDSHGDIYLGMPSGRAVDKYVRQ